MRKFPMNLSPGMEQPRVERAISNTWAPWIIWIQWSWLIKCIESVWNWYIILGPWTQQKFSSTSCYSDLTDERSKENTLIAAGRTRAYWFWFILCCVWQYSFRNSLKKNDIFFLFSLLVFVFCLTFVVKRIKSNQSIIVLIWCPPIEAPFVNYL